MRMPGRAGTHQEMGDPPAQWQSPIFGTSYSSFGNCFGYEDSSKKYPLEYSFYFASFSCMSPVPSLLSLRGSGTTCTTHPPPPVAFYQVGRGEVGTLFGFLRSGFQNVGAAFGCGGMDERFLPRPPPAYFFFQMEWGYSRVPLVCVFATLHTTWDTLQAAPAMGEASPGTFFCRLSFVTRRRGPKHPRQTFSGPLRRDQTAAGLTRLPKWSTAV